MTTKDLEIAKKSLQLREEIPDKSFSISIASVTMEEETTNDTKRIIKDWAISLKLDAVIWTSL